MTTTRPATSDARARKRRVATTRRAGIREDDFQRQVTELATFYGWRWVHVRPGQYTDGRFATMTSGTLARGWPDLVMVQPSTGRLLFAELKVPPNTPTDDQRRVLDVLRCVMFAEVYIWRPDDWSDIQRVLR